MKSTQSVTLSMNNVKLFDQLVSIEAGIEEVDTVTSAIEACPSSFLLIHVVMYTYVHNIKNKLPYILDASYNHWLRR